MNKIKNKWTTLPPVSPGEVGALDFCEESNVLTLRNKRSKQVTQFPTNFGEDMFDANEDEDCFEDP